MLRESRASTPFVLAVQSVANSTNLLNLFCWQYWGRSPQKFSLDFNTFHPHEDCTFWLYQNGTILLCSPAVLPFIIDGVVIKITSLWHWALWSFYNQVAAHGQKNTPIFSWFIVYLHKQFILPSYTFSCVFSIEFKILKRMGIVQSLNWFYHCVKEEVRYCRSRKELILCKNQTILCSHWVMFTQGTNRRV